MTKENILEFCALVLIGIAMCTAAFTLGAGITAGYLADNGAQSGDAAALVIWGACMLWLAACMLHAFENR